LEFKDSLVINKDMNIIITKRTNPAVRFKIKGVLLARQLNEHISWKKQVDKVLRMRIEEINTEREHEYIIESD
jgi:hypothetical protein